MLTWFNFVRVFCWSEKEKKVFGRWSLSLLQLLRLMCKKNYHTSSIAIASRTPTHTSIAASLPIYHDAVAYPPAIQNSPTQAPPIASFVTMPPNQFLSTDQHCANQQKNRRVCAIQRPTVTVPKHTIYTHHYWCCISHETKDKRVVTGETMILRICIDICLLYFSVIHN